MKSDPTTQEPRTYWPRFGPAVPPPDFEDDRYCSNCGYNLRGLAYNDACPECGSEHGMSPSEEPLPWDQQRTLGNYFLTLHQILIDPAEFGSQVWRLGKLDWRAARSFRHINTTIGATCLGAVILALSADVAGPIAALAALPISMLAVLVWLNRLTLDRLRFLEQENLLPRDPQRVKALVSYLSASMALAPVHLAGLYASRQALQSNVWPAAAGIHLLLLFVQLLLISQAEAHLLWQLIEMPKGQARAMGVAAAVGRLFTASFYCVLLPVLFVVIAKHAVHG